MPQLHIITIESCVMAKINTITYKIVMVQEHVWLVFKNMIDEI